MMQDEQIYASLIKKRGRDITNCAILKRPSTYPVKWVKSTALKHVPKIKDLLQQQLRYSVSSLRYDPITQSPLKFDFIASFVSLSLLYLGESLTVALTGPFSNIGGK